MEQKVFKTRIILKTNTTEYWNSIQNTFVPLFGEIIIYNDKDIDGNLLPARMKVGNGETILANLPFSGGITDGLTVDITGAEQGIATLINADQLGGVAAKDYMLKAEYLTVEDKAELINEIIAALPVANGVSF